MRWRQHVPEKLADQQAGEQYRNHGMVVGVPGRLCSLIAHGFAPLAVMLRSAAPPAGEGRFFRTAPLRSRAWARASSNGIARFFSGFDVFLRAGARVNLREEALDICIFASFGRIVPPSMEGWRTRPREGT